MDRLFAILEHPALAVMAGAYLMGISFAYTFFGIVAGPVVLGSLLWIGGALVAVTIKKSIERSDTL